MTEPDLTPTWRRQPFRVLFPLGVALAWAGVLPWLLFGLGAADYRSVYHPFAQIQGFLACFAVGFLFTMIPRRTQTRAPSAAEMAIAILMPIGTTVFAWSRMWTASQACWLILLATLLTFAVRRFRAAEAGHGAPRSFVWVPISILMGLVGSVLVILGFEAAVSPVLHTLGRLLLLQGMFVGLVLGVGGMLLPLITRGESPPPPDPSDARARVTHLLAAIALVVTFVLEANGSTQLGLSLRAALVTAVLLLSSRIHRTPCRDGWHRWLVWLGAWCLPIGYLLAALWPDRMQLGLHVVFLGGLGQMALCVGLHVTLAHSGVKDLASSRPWQVPVLGALLLAAMVLRGLVQVLPEDQLTWLALSAAAFLLATLCWAWLALPYMSVRRSS